jgi:surface antigen
VTSVENSTKQTEHNLKYLLEKFKKEKFMHIKNFTILSLLVLAFTTSACADKYADGTHSRGINKDDGGAIIGGIAGGLAGNQLGKGSGNSVATIGGVALGAIVGHGIGGAMDQPVDKAQYAKQNARPANYNILQEALENIRLNEVSAMGDYLGEQVQVMPTSTFTNNISQNCRNYRIIKVAGGSILGTACRQDDGYWR